MHPLLFVLALARPTEVLEEWTLLETAPVRELVTARVVYDRDRGPEIALPTVFDCDRAPPSVQLVGHLRPLTVTRVGASWHARLPEATSTPRPRVVVRSVREARDLRLFQLRWPLTNGEAIRRVAIVPRGWMQVMSEGWTCADDSISSIACVSIDTRPNPLRVRVSPLSSSRGAWLATALLSLATCALFALSKPPRARLAAGASWIVGLVATNSVALTLVGARWTSWAVALCAASLSATALAALAGDDVNARRTGAMSALATALLSVFDGRPSRSLAALATASVALAIARWLSRAAPHPSPSHTGPRSSAEEESRPPSP